MRFFECPYQMRGRKTCLGADLLQSERTRAVAPNEVGSPRKTGSIFVMRRSACTKMQLYHSRKCNRSALLFQMLNLRIDQCIEEAIQPIVQLGLRCRDQCLRKPLR